MKDVKENLDRMRERARAGTSEDWSDFITIEKEINIKNEMILWLTDNFSPNLCAFLHKVDDCPACKIYDSTNINACQEEVLRIALNKVKI